jgi:hypothetical protein
MLPIVGVDHKDLTQMVNVLVAGVGSPGALPNFFPVAHAAANKGWVEGTRRRKSWGRQIFGRRCLRTHVINQNAENSCADWLLDIGLIADSHRSELWLTLDHGDPRTSSIGGLPGAASHSLRQEAPLSTFLGASTVDMS